MAVALLLWQGSTIAFAQASSESTITSKIIALENAWSRAAETKDLRSLDWILDDAFVYVDTDGRLLTRAEVLRDVNQSGVEQMVTEAMVVHVHGSTAVVTGSFRTKSARDGKLVSQRGRFVDTWIFKNNSWICIASAAIATAR